MVTLVEGVVGRRLTELQIVHSGHRFLLLSAKHVSSDQRVLVTVSRPGVPEGLAQLANIARLLSSASSNALGTLIDRFFPIDNDLSRPDRWGCLATTWHEDATTLQNAIVAHAPINLLHSLREITLQLERIHSLGFAHGDVSLANVLVTKTGSIHLVDFEHVTSENFLFERQAFLTSGYSHPERLRRISQGEYSIEDAQNWDRYALGQLFLQVLADSDPYRYEELSLYNQRAIRLIGCLLLGGTNAPAEVALGLDIGFFRSDYYRSLSDVVTAIDRLIGLAAPETFIPEMRAVPERVVEIGTHRPVPFTTRVRNIVESTEMQQLGTCLQLGLISYIWPTATHTRIEHAIGTFGIACEAVLNLYADPQSPLFKVLGTPAVVRSLLAAALLHDVGHYPLAHDLEEAFPKAFDHETRSVAFVVQGSIADSLRAPEPDGWDVNPFDVASIIDGNPLEGSALSHWMCGLLHSLISGAIDVDKLDYLVRDSSALGVAAGEGIDIDRVLASLTVALVPTTTVRSARKSSGPDVPRLAVRAKGIRPAELVGRIRSHMFGVTYWHHSYRSIKAMIHWIVWQAILQSQGKSTIGRKAELLARELFAALDSKERESFLPGFERQWRSFSQMPQREGSVLAFLVEHGSDHAKPMLDLLEQRRWFKPVMTIDHYENVEVYDRPRGRRDKQLWDVVAKLPEAGDRNLTARVAIAQDLQSSIIKWLEPRTEGAISATVVENWTELKVQIQTQSYLGQLFLVDFVETRKSVEKKLYFAIAERRGLRLTNMTQGIPVRQSYDQHQLQKEFMVSNGAIRLLCHPDFDDFVVRSIPTDILFEMLLDSCKRIIEAS
jgi:HD superfamily phosphohydrolase